jgi:hypothetical protein
METEEGKTPRRGDPNFKPKVREGSSGTVPRGLAVTKFSAFLPPIHAALTFSRLFVVQSEYEKGISFL